MKLTWNWREIDAKLTWNSKFDYEVSISQNIYQILVSHTYVGNPGSCRPCAMCTSGRQYQRYHGPRGDEYRNPICHEAEVWPGPQCTDHNVVPGQKTRLSVGHRVCAAVAQWVGCDSLGRRQHHSDCPGKDSQAGHDSRIICRRETGDHPWEVPSLLEASAGGDRLRS